MAARSTYSKSRLAAIIAGLILTAIEVYGAWSFLVTQAAPNYLVAGGAVVTLVAAGLPIWAGRCWRDGRYLIAIFLWMALVPALSVIVTAAVERTGSARDTADRHHQVTARNLGLAREARQDAKEEVDRLRAKAETECSTAKNAKADPRGPKCLAAEELAEKGRQRLEAATAKLAGAGVAQKDPMVSRIAAVIPVSEEAIRIYQPLVLPLSISALGLLLIAVGAHEPRRKVLPRRGKRKRRRHVRRSQPSQKGNVVPLRKSA